MLGTNVFGLRFKHYDTCMFLHLHKYFDTCMFVHINKVLPTKQTVLKIAILFQDSRHVFTT